MKNLLFLLAFIPTLAFSQVSNWRTTPPQQSQPQQRVETPRVQPSAPQRNDVSRWRNESPREYNRPQPNRRGSNIIVRDPWLMNNWGWGWNRFPTKGN